MKEQKEKTQAKCDQRRHFVDDAFQFYYINSIRLRAILEYFHKQFFSRQSKNV